MLEEMKQPSRSCKGLVLKSSSSSFPCERQFFSMKKRKKKMKEIDKCLYCLFSHLMNNDSQPEENRRKWALKLTTILFNVLCSVDMSIRHSFSHQYHLRNGSESFRKFRWSSPNRITQLLKSVEGGQIKPPLCLRGEDSWFTCTWSHRINDIYSAFIIKLLIQWISY